jgi:hypothetical protein
MGQLTISMAMFNSYVKLPEGNPYFIPNFIQWGYVYVRGYDVQHVMHIRGLDSARGPVGVLQPHVSVGFLT